MNLVRDISYNPTVNTGVAKLIPQSTSLNGTKTYATRQTAHKVSVPPQKINKILIGNRCSSFTSKSEQTSATYGRFSEGIKNPDPIKTIDIGTFVPPTVGLADFVEED